MRKTNRNIESKQKFTKNKFRGTNLQNTVHGKSFCGNSRNQSKITKMNITKVFGIIGGRAICESSITTKDNFIAFDKNEMECVNAIAVINSAMKQKGLTDTDVFSAIAECIVKINEYRAQRAAVSPAIYAAIETIAQNAVMVVQDSILRFIKTESEPHGIMAQIRNLENTQQIAVPTVAGIQQQRRIETPQESLEIRNQIQQNAADIDMIFGAGTAEAAIRIWNEEQ